MGRRASARGAERGLLPATGPLPHRIQPPPCPLQSSLLRDLMMHPLSPSRVGVCFSPLPQSLMVLCNQLIPASQPEAARTHGWIPHMQSSSPHASPSHQDPLLPHSPPAAARGAATCGAEPIFPGAKHGVAGIPKPPHTSPGIQKTARSLGLPMSSCHIAP